MSKGTPLTLEDFDRLQSEIGECLRPLFDMKHLPIRVQKMVELSVLRSEGKGKDHHVEVCQLCGSWVWRYSDAPVADAPPMVTIEPLREPSGNGYVECRGCHDLIQAHPKAYEFIRSAFKWQKFYLEEWLHEQLVELEARQALHANLLQATIRDQVAHEARLTQNEKTLSKAADAIEAITKKIVEQLPPLAERMGQLAEVVQHRLGIKVGKA